MVTKLFTYFLILALCKQALFSDEDNRVEAEVDSDNDDGGLTVEDLKNELLNEENLKNLGGAITNFIQSDGGKQIGNMIMNGLKDGGGNVIMNQLLQGVGNLMQQQTSVGDPKRGETGSSGAGMGGLSPELMGSLLNMMMQAKTGDGSGAGVDFNSIMQMLMSFNAQDSPMGYMNLIPTIMQMMATSFTGPEAQKRELKHAEHAGMFPPIVEKLHIFVDHFVNSEMGAALMESTGANKALKMFSDERGNFSYPKFVEMFENHSFRKHWISIATKRVANFVSYFADPYTQKKFMTTFTLFVNNFLKGQGVPKTALFDPTLPNESLTALANYLSKKFLGQKIDSKRYIQPIVAYFQDLVNMAEHKGLVGSGVDSDELSHKIADTINLEIIEPVVRVNRAYRFAQRVPKCDRYVFCLVNEEQPDEVQSIPGLKHGLSRISSIVASWFISDQGHTSFWSLYHVIVEENNCRARYLEECQQFHVEEIKVTTEYVHNEL